MRIYAVLLVLLVGCAAPIPLTMLTVVPEGDGFGTVASEPAGLSCDDAQEACSASFPEGTRVTLRAAAGETSAFRGWGGACAGLEPCTLTLNEAQEVTARFERTRFVLGLGVSGEGVGEVRIVPPDVTCTADCERLYTPGLVVSLNPIPASGSSFLGWEGECEGAGLCEVTMSADRQVRAVFTLPPPVIASFTATPTRILAGQSSQLEWRVSGDGPIQLEITPNVGDVTGRERVRVSPSGDTTYTLSATSPFGTVQRRVEVEVEPSRELLVRVQGTGLVESVSPVNVIRCQGTGGDCQEFLALNTTVTLEATSGSVADWRGCDSAAGRSCTVTMDGNKTVTAVFR